MFYWIYDLPTWQLVVLIASVFIAFSWTGTLFVRPFIRIFVGRRPEVNDAVGYLFGAHAAFYGILLGLLALAAYQNYTQADGIVALEAARLGALYRDVSSYPEPARGELQAHLREYTRFVIEEAWPQQQKGMVPKGGTQRMTRFQERLTQFEPVTKGQEILHAETFRQFNSMIEARRLRLNAVNSAIPPILWFVVFIGAVFNMMFVWLLNLRIVAHLFLGAVSAFFLATLVAVVAAMDNPFRGEVCISTDAYRLVSEQIMNTEPAASGPKQ
ncbi:MAG: DUF4239 domain-containing protein [Gemmataceae bacterium]|nr:DUF4239 domain-containing protein [Gemmataceae bacterium]